SRKPVGFEALSRFPADPHAPVEGWFNLASRAGMGLELERACIAAIVDGVLRGPDMQGYISINVSPRTLMDTEFDLPDRSALG
ncbi:hypothetical protein AB9E34_33675, partial [Rhizobium leguminosarum]